jgi:ubiquinone/menaquinone biosynthesis C-methylase UbiE
MTIDPTYLRRVAQSPAIRSIKDHAYELLNLQPGESVLDLGCGPAIDTIALSALVGVNGRVVGIDSDPAMVAEADRAASKQAVSVRHETGSASALRFGNEEFDACFSDRLFQHMPWAECVTVVREIRRVLKRGGRTVLIDTDWGTLSIAAPDPFLERRIVKEHAVGFAHPFAGRHLYGLLKTAGFHKLAIETFDLQLSPEGLEFLLAPTLTRAVMKGIITQDEARSWSAGLQTTGQYGLFFAHVATVMASAQNGQ